MQHKLVKIGSIFMLNPPLQRRCCTQSLPVYPGGEPVPLFCAHTMERFTRQRPAEATLVQAAMTQPDTCTVPHQQLDACMAAIGKTVSSAIAGRAPVCLLNQQRQAVYAPTHVHRCQGQKYLLGLDHLSHAPSNWAQASAPAIGQRMCMRVAPRWISNWISPSEGEG